MAGTLDGASILAAVIRDPSTFELGPDKLDAMALTVVRDALVGTAGDVSRLAAIAAALGPDLVDGVVAHLGANDLDSVCRAVFGQTTTTGLPAADTGQGSGSPVDADQRGRLHALLRTTQAKKQRIAKTRDATKSASSGDKRGGKTGRIMKSMALRSRSS